MELAIKFVGFCTLHKNYCENESLYAIIYWKDVLNYCCEDYC